MREWVTSSWNTQYEGGLHPGRASPGLTSPAPTASRPSTERADTPEKSALLKDVPVEVGPLAQLLLAYLSGPADHPAKKLVDDTLAAVGQAGNPTVLLSNLGRIAARVLKVKIVADQTSWLPGPAAGADGGRRHGLLHPGA